MNWRRFRTNSNVDYNICGGRHSPSPNLLYPDLMCINEPTLWVDIDYGGALPRVAGYFCLEHAMSLIGAASGTTSRIYLKKFEVKRM